MPLQVRQAGWPLTLSGRSLSSRGLAIRRAIIRWIVFCLKSEAGRAAWELAYRQGTMCGSGQYDPGHYDPVEFGHCQNSSSARAARMVEVRG